MPKLNATSDTVKDYQRLLLADWDRTFPEQVVGLLWDTLGKKSVVDDPFAGMLDPRSFQLAEETLAGILQRMTDAGRFVAQFELPDLPKTYHLKRPSKAKQQALQLSLYLTLTAHCALDGAVDYFHDVQSLAFQAAAHFVLPELSGSATEEYAILLHAMVLFSLTSVKEPAQFYHLVSILEGILGNPDRRLQYLLASFRSTPPEDHSYLTKAQEYWMELLDAGHFIEAENFLVDLHYWCLPEQREEVREMTVEAFRVTSPSVSRTRSRTG